MKTKDKVIIEGKPVFYAVLYNSMKKAALDLGYALAMHGSMHSDMDLIAVAWTEEAESHEKLAAAIQECIGQTVWKENNLSSFVVKPHGRIVYSLSILGDWYIDLSIIPPRKVVPLSEIKDFFFETAEDWHLWDEDESPYPVQRVFKAMDNFLKENGKETTD